MRSTRTVIFCLLALAAMAAATHLVHAQQPAARAEAKTGAAVPLESILDHMEEAQQRNRDNYRAYTMTREYKLYASEQEKPKTEVLADVSFVPPDRKTFKIEKTEGSDRGVSIVRHLLEHESQAAAAQTAPGAVDRRNYDFKLEGEDVVDGQPCWRLQLLPKREERTLIRGSACVDKESYLIHDIEGELAKSPSWWLKSVQTSIHFGNAAGMWLQTQTRAEADVRMFGKHVFTAHAVKVQTTDEVATRFSSRAPSFSGMSAAMKSNVRTVSVAQHRPTRPVPPLIGAGIIR